MTDPTAFHEGVGRLLAEVQRIKGEGDYVAARRLFETYGVHFDPKLRDEVVARVDKLNLPSYTGFVMPKIEPVATKSGEIGDVSIELPPMFFTPERQIVEAGHGGRIHQDIEVAPEAGRLRQHDRKNVERKTEGLGGGPAADLDGPLVASGFCGGRHLEVDPDALALVWAQVNRRGFPERIWGVLGVFVDGHQTRIADADQFRPEPVSRGRPQFGRMDRECRNRLRATRSKLDDHVPVPAGPHLYTTVVEIPAEARRIDMLVRISEPDLKLPFPRRFGTFKPLARGDKGKTQ
jgi:hypothetical protein